MNFHNFQSFFLGLIKFVQDTLIPQLVEKVAFGSDLDIRVISAYINQCTAEAQEVTIARAIELKHNPSLIASLGKFMVIRPRKYIHYV